MYLLGTKYCTGGFDLLQNQVHQSPGTVLLSFNMMVVNTWDPVWHSLHSSGNTSSCPHPPDNKKYTFCIQQNVIRKIESHVLANSVQMMKLVIKTVIWKRQNNIFNYQTLFMEKFWIPVFCFTFVSPSTATSPSCLISVRTLFIKSYTKILFCFLAWKC